MFDVSTTEWWKTTASILTPRGAYMRHECLWCRLMHSGRLTTTVVWEHNVQHCRFGILCRASYRLLTTRNQIDVERHQFTCCAYRLGYYRVAVVCYVISIQHCKSLPATRPFAFLFVFTTNNGFIAFLLVIIYYRFKFNTFTLYTLRIIHAHRTTSMTMHTTVETSHAEQPLIKHIFQEIECSPPKFFEWILLRSMNEKSIELNPINSIGFDQQNIIRWQWIFGSEESCIK